MHCLGSVGPSAATQNALKAAGATSAQGEYTSLPKEMAPTRVAPVQAISNHPVRSRIDMTSNPQNQSQTGRSHVVRASPRLPMLAPVLRPTPSRFPWRLPLRKARPRQDQLGSFPPRRGAGRAQVPSGLTRFHKIHSSR